MTKYKEEEFLLKDVLGTIKNKIWKGKLEWKDGNSLIFIEDKKEIGKIVFNDKEITITGKKIDNLYNKYKKIYLKAEKNKATSEDVARTPLADMFNSLSKFNGLEINPKVLGQMNAGLEKFGIKKVVMEGQLTQNDSLTSDPTLYISTSPDNCGKVMASGWINRLKTFLFDEFEKNNLKTKEEIHIRDIRKFNSLEGEKPTKMTYKGTTLGYYFPERNLIHLVFNPFSLKRQSVFTDKIQKNWEIVFKMFKAAKVKKVDVSDIQEKLFISEFLKSSRDRLDSVKESQQNTKTEIDSLEKSIRRQIEDYTTFLSEEHFLQTLINNKGKGLFKEIEKVRKMPFIDLLEIEGSQINIRCRPTFMPISNMIRHGGGKNYGKRYIWVGSVGFKISPGKFKVYGDVDIYNNHCHPHGSSFPEGNPCFGSGDGRNKIYELLAANNFVDLVKMLWFWVKTFKNSGAYVKAWDTYDGVLRQGYPIFDEKRKRIKLNDPVRLKTGEQISLDKGSNYEDNIKKFAKTKLEE